MAGDFGMLWKLAAGGLTAMPGGRQRRAPPSSRRSWNRYYLKGNASACPAMPSRRGLPAQTTPAAAAPIPAQPIPEYQQDYGLRPVTNDPYRLPGRGTPDVSANAGGDMFWLVPDADMAGVQGRRAAPGGVDAVLGRPDGAAQRGVPRPELPRLGYMNDLLYIAAAIAPAVFNDITMGTNASSFVLGGGSDQTESDGEPSQHHADRLRLLRPRRAMTWRVGSARPTPCCWPAS